MSATPQPSWPRSALVLVWTLACALYAGTSTMIFHSFVVTGFDNAIIEQVVARLAHFSAPITEVEGNGVNYFGDHFSPVLAVYAPFYRLVPEPETLFAVQGGVLALSVVVILVTATRHLGRSSGLMVAVLYALSFGLLNSVVVSARETPFAVLLLALAGACYLNKSTRGVVLASLCLLLVKEDLGLTVGAIGFVLALEAHSRRAGVALMVIGPTFFVLVMTVILPTFRSVDEFNRIPSSLDAMLDAAFDGGGIKLLTVALTFGVAGLLAARSRWSLVVLPTFAWRFTSPKVTFWTPAWHYSAALMPVVFVAAIVVLRDSSRRERRWTLAVASTATILPMSWAALQAMPVYDAYGSARQDAARQSLRSIPVGASVVSDEYLVGHLAGDRTTYYMVLFAGCPRPEYVVAHVGRPERNIWGGWVDTAQFEDVDQLMNFADAAYDGRHDVVSLEGDYAVLRRDDPGASTPCVPTDAGSGLNSGPDKDNPS